MTRPATATAASADRGNYLITGATVVTVDPELGDLVDADIHVQDGVIQAVGSGLSVPAGAEVIDASNMIAVPGFVETHWHMWTSSWRGLAHDASQYIALQRLAGVAEPEDHYAAVRYAATEAINAGITTCHDWAHALRGGEDAEAEAQALVDSGIRARFGYGHAPVPGLGPVSAGELEHLQAWLDQHGDGRIDLGVVSQVQQHLLEELTTARSLGLKTVGPHADLAAVADRLGPDVLFTHGPGTPPAFVAHLAAAGVRFALCPTTDPLIGAGLPPVGLLLDNGVDPRDISISVDVTAQGSADPFAAMRTVLTSARIHQQRGASFADIVFRPADPSDPTMGLMMPRDVLAMATLNGARALGLDDVLGSLTPGKRADVVLVRTSDVNMLPVSDANPTYQLVQHAQPANVDTVLVDGRLLKRHGQLLGVDVPTVVAAAAASQRRLRQRGGVTVDPAL